MTTPPSLTPTSKPEPAVEPDSNDGTTTAPEVTSTPNSESGPSAAEPEFEPPSRAEETLPSGEEEDDDEEFEDPTIELLAMLAEVASEISAGMTEREKQKTQRSLASNLSLQKEVAADQKIAELEQATERARIKAETEIARLNHEANRVRLRQTTILSGLTAAFIAGILALVGFGSGDWGQALDLVEKIGAVLLGILSALGATTLGKPNPKVDSDE